MVGVPSTSEVGSRPEKRAQYHVYTARSIDSHDLSKNGFQLEAEIRGFDSVTEEFRHVDERLF